MLSVLLRCQNFFVSVENALWFRPHLFFLLQSLFHVVLFLFLEVLFDVDSLIAGDYWGSAKRNWINIIHVVVLNLIWLIWDFSSFEFKVPGQVKQLLRICFLVSLGHNNVPFLIESLRLINTLNCPNERQPLVIELDRLWLLKLYNLDKFLCSD
jgi:hypothetical protein